MKATLALSILALSLLTACGQSNNSQQAAAPATSAAPASPAAAPASPARVETAAADAAPSKGEDTFKKTCALCHKTGEAGAPKLGSKEDWAPRIAQGKDTLYEHALKGFTGQKGMMPAKGGSASLADDDVKAAVDYMMSKAQ